MKTRKHDKYIFDGEEIERECYQITSFFLASERIHLLQRRSSNWGVKRFILQEQHLIKTLLISLAIKIRMIDDLMKDAGKCQYKPSKDRAGRLKDGDKTVDLTVREACNKIIHANAIEFVLDYSQHGSKKIRHLAPEVVLRGKKNGQEWEAQLKILRFVDLVLALSVAYDESWDVSGYSQ